MTADKTSPGETRPIHGPLGGIRVIDMTSVLAGPYATQIIADYGADVIKVEPPGGDLMRIAAAKKNPTMGPLFLHANRNKRSVVIDLKQTDGRETLLEMCKHADMVIHNVRHDAIERLGLSYEDIRATNEDIVYVHILGYGSDGPYSGRPAYDDLIQGVSGMAGMYFLTGATEPQMIPAALADRFTGLHAAHAAIAALFHRTRTGQGQLVEVPMFESMVQAMLGDHFGGLTFDPPAGPPGYNRILSPHRRPYKTKDGYLCMLASTNSQWHRFLVAIGRHDLWENDARFSDSEIRNDHYDDVYAFLSDVLSERSTAEWLELLTACDVPVSIVNQIEDLEFDPHIVATGLIQRTEHETEGTIKQIKPTASFSKTPLSIYLNPPNIGEHTIPVLTELGWDSSTIAYLVETGAIKQRVPTGRTHMESQPSASTPL